jgi:FMN phosphatase YigB (HAD superfamily)
VLIRTEDHRPRAALEAQFGLAPGEAEYLVYNSASGQQAQLGLVTASAHWASLQQRFRLTDTELRAFQTAFWGGDRVDTALLAFIRTLQPRYHLAIISNAMDDLHETVARLDPTGDLFAPVVGSAYEGVMKPDALIFERTLARLGCQPAEAVFVDDNAVNVTGAEAVGLAAIQFQPGLDLPKALARLGVVAN